MNITTAHASGAEIERIIKTKIGPSVVGEGVGVTFIALLAYAAHTMRSSITADELSEAVKGMSGWLVTYLSTLPTEEQQQEFDFGIDPEDVGPIDPKRVN